MDEDNIEIQTPDSAQFRRIKMPPKFYIISNEIVNAAPAAIIASNQYPKQFSTKIYSDILDTPMNNETIILRVNNEEWNTPNLPEISTTVPSAQSLASKCTMESQFDDSDCYIDEDYETDSADETVSYRVAKLKRYNLAIKDEAPAGWEFEMVNMRPKTVPKKKTSGVGIDSLKNSEPESSITVSLTGHSSYTMETRVDMPGIGSRVTFDSAAAITDCNFDEDIETHIESDRFVAGVNETIISRVDNEELNTPNLPEILITVPSAQSLASKCTMENQFDDSDCYIDEDWETDSADETVSYRVAKLKRYNLAIKDEAPAGWEFEMVNMRPKTVPKKKTSGVGIDSLKNSEPESSITVSLTGHSSYTMETRVDMPGIGSRVTFDSAAAITDCNFDEDIETHIESAANTTIPHNYLIQTQQQPAGNVTSESKNTVAIPPLKKTANKKKTVKKTKNVRTKTKSGNRKITLNMQPNNVGQFQWKEQNSNIPEDIPRTLIRKKILVSAPSRFATEISSEQINANIDVNLSADSVETPDLCETNSIALSVHGNGNPVADEGTTLVLQKLDSINRRMDGHAMQNSEMIIKIENIDKDVKEVKRLAKYSNLDDQWELSQIIPVTTVDDFQFLMQRLANDEEFYNKMLRYLRNFKGKPTKKKIACDHFGSVLRRIALDKVIVQYNYRGIKKKLKLENELVVELLFDIYKPMDRTVFTENLKQTIQFAKGRFYNEKYRNSHTSVSQKN